MKRRAFDAYFRVAVEVGDRGQTHEQKTTWVDRIPISLQKLKLADLDFNLKHGIMSAL